MNSKNFKVVLKKTQTKKNAQAKNRQRRRQEQRQSGLIHALEVKLSQWHDEEYEAGKTGDDYR